MLKYFKSVLIALLLQNGYAHAFTQAFYAGLNMGAGQTTWSGLVPSISNQNSAILISTPNKVNEGGLVYGMFGGYEFSPHLAVEGFYLHYPQAQIFFTEDSIFSFMHDNRTSFISNTDTIGFMAKLMLPLPDTPFRVFSAVGAARINRHDELFDEPCISPSFTLGAVYNISQHLMGQLSLNYTAGFGESELEPTHSYIPFLYSAVFGLAFRF